MKRKRFAALCCAAALLLCLFAGCSVRGRRVNAQKLLDSDFMNFHNFAAQTLYTGTLDESVYFPGVEGYDFVPPDWLGFQTGIREDEENLGICCGFYYSPDDAPLGYKGEAMELSPFGDGYRFLMPDGRMEYYTERIKPNWFFYEYNEVSNREEDPILKPEL